MMSTKISYTVALSELQQIVREMESAEISIDDLDSKVKRATELLKICREKLYATEQNVTDILKSIETE